LSKERNVPATPEELKSLVDAYDQAHPSLARAMAELLVRGNVILEDHRLLEGEVGDRFEAFVFHVLAEHSIGKEAFAATLIAYERLRDTIDQLDRLPP
jgi:hypothetical protein